MSEPNPYASPAERTPGPAVELEPPQEIRYLLVEDDLIAAMQQTASRVPEIAALHHKRRLLYLVIGGVACLLALWLARLNNNNFSSMIAAPTGVGFFFLYRAATYQQFARRQTRARTRAYIKSGVISMQDEYQRCVVSAEGVVTEEPMIRSQIGWPKVVRVVQTADHLLLYVQPSTPIVIPGKAFTSEEHFDGYCRLAKRLWEEHHEDETTPVALPAAS
ncbi:hypothetical protein Pla123a_01060 [Posidoniimonas polymericola]|uniref:YcxB-like C-terminal domain-containing protein n=1 Tax=Posidoniimonas polymericola TaxID=2528002 RepID=A0A5C5ZD19_9BACT|nr:YcxB family protein [Posidoniimonas polymericola]TWT85299.1 hypothetical protein Pla123a_01060 [Posidoniimonas polymericola]